MVAFSFSSLIVNQPERKGQLAEPAARFGEFGRYAVAPVFTRFDAVEWFVWDAETEDPVTGRAAVIRQQQTLEEALRGLL